MYGCENWTIKKAECWRINAFELWCWRRPVHPQGNHSLIFIGRTDAEAPILWPPDGKSQLIGKDPNARKNWGQEEKGTTEDEMVGWHHWLNGHEFEETLGDSDGQRRFVCWSSLGSQRVGHDLVTEQQQSFRVIYYVVDQNIEKYTRLVYEN